MEIKYTSNIPFLARGGEMGKLTREKDWSNTSIGDPQTGRKVYALRSTFS
jgi:hypothetical protein